MGREPGGRGTSILIQVGLEDYGGRNGMERGLEWAEFRWRNLMGVRTACVRVGGESRGESRSRPGYPGDADARRHRGELGWGSRWAGCCVFCGAPQIRLATGTSWERCQGRDTDFRDAHRGESGHGTLCSVWSSQGVVPMGQPPECLAWCAQAFTQEPKTKSGLIMPRGNI